MKKLLTVGIVLLAVVAGGAWYAKSLVEKKLGDQVVSVLNNPQTQKEIQHLIQQHSQDLVSQALHQVASTNPSNTSSGQTAGSAVSGSGESGASISVASGVSRAPSASDTHSADSAQDKSSGKANGTTSGTENTSTTPVFKNRADVIRFALSRFTPSEILHYMALYANRNHLTAAEKEEIKREILSHFTPQELAAMMAAINN